MMKKYTEKVIVKSQWEGEEWQIDRNVIFNLSDYARKNLSARKPPPAREILHLPNLDTTATKEVLRYLEAIHSSDQQDNVNNPSFEYVGMTTFLDKVLRLEVIVALKVRPKAAPRRLQQEINDRITNDPNDPLSLREIRMVWEGLAHHRQRLQGNKKSDHLEPSRMLKHLVTYVGKRRALSMYEGQPDDDLLERYLYTQPELRWKVDDATRKELGSLLAKCNRQPQLRQGGTQPTIRWW